MTKSISDDLRCRVIAAVAGGLSRRAAAVWFGVVAASAVRWVRAWRENGATWQGSAKGAANAHGGSKPIETRSWQRSRVRMTSR